jgi:hypothetical protein
MLCGSYSWRKTPPEEPPMTRPRLTIAPNANGLGRHKVLADGQDISHGVRSVRLSLDPGELPSVELELAVIEIDGIDVEESRLYVPDATREALIALGWTPPEDIRG